MRRRLQVAIDCFDATRLAAFWIEVLGYRQSAPPGHESWSAFSAAEAHEPGESWHRIEDPDGVGPTLLFHRVPEQKAVKNRLHLDIFLVDNSSPDHRDAVIAEAVRLVDLGASRVRNVDADDDFYIVMQDPEGNEFCIA